MRKNVLKTTIGASNVELKFQIKKLTCASWEPERLQRLEIVPVDVRCQCESLVVQPEVKLFPSFILVFQLEA